MTGTHDERRRRRGGGDPPLLLCQPMSITRADLSPPPSLPRREREKKEKALLGGPYLSGGEREGRDLELGRRKLCIFIKGGKGWRWWCNMGVLPLSGRMRGVKPNGSQNRCFLLSCPFALFSFPYMRHCVWGRKRKCFSSSGFFYSAVCTHLIRRRRRFTHYVGPPRVEGGSSLPPPSLLLTPPQLNF